MRFLNRSYSFVCSSGSPPGTAMLAALAAVIRSWLALVWSVIIRSPNFLMSGLLAWFLASSPSITSCLPSAAALRTNVLSSTGRSEDEDFCPFGFCAIVQLATASSAATPINRASNRIANPPVVSDSPSGPRAG